VISPPPLSSPPFAPPPEGVTVLRLGTRGSALALAQSGQVARALEEAHPGLRVELVPIVTRGDRLPGDLAAAGGKGLFTAELESGLLSGALDLAVHSLKDLPVAVPAGLVLAAHPRRADPRDVLVSEVATDLAGLPEGAVVLTGSLRRQAQLLLHRPDLRVEPLRGNVDTRLRRWRESGAAAVVLAAAGLERLGHAAEGFPIHPLALEVMLPAPGQGTLALQTRANSPAARLCRPLDDPPTAAAAAAERRVVAAFGGDCTLPLAAWARPAAGDPARLRLAALLATPDGRHAARAEGDGATPEEAADACIAALRAHGAEMVLARLRGGVAEEP
jgi:hydroxymethylbilane synthase